jgi:hypothetical protein
VTFGHNPPVPSPPVPSPPMPVPVYIESWWVPPENLKPQFWHFEPWFPKVLEISENTLLYIIASSFGSGGVGGGEGFYIRLWCGGRGMRSDRHSFPSDGCDALWRSGPNLYTWPVRKPLWSSPRHRLTPVARCFTGLSLPHPPKPPSQTNWLTDKLAELIYRMWMK